MTEKQNRFFTNIKPTVPRLWLFGMAGLMWTLVGCVLCWRAYGWLEALPKNTALTLGAAGVALALVAERIGFSEIARRNTRRLNTLARGSCAFAFQPWRGYLIIGLMITLGLVLRHSSVPRTYLAIMYITMGGGLILASLQYYKRIWRILTGMQDGREQTGR